MDLGILPKDIVFGEREVRLIKRKLGTDIYKVLKSFPEELLHPTVRVRQGARWGFWVSYSLFLPKKHHIYVEEKDKVLRKAINAVKIESIRQIRKFKEKRRETSGQ